MQLYSWIISARTRWFVGVSGLLIVLVCALIAGSSFSWAITYASISAPVWMLFVDWACRGVRRRKQKQMS
jgi:hypothetical protein